VLVVVQMPQGVSADLIATKYGFSRDECDAYAVESQKRAARPQRLHVGARPAVLVVVQQRQAVDVAHRHDRVPRSCRCATSTA
jgi:acetyl-CoA acetyltransferase